jgi:hypothetical protein
MGQQHYDTYRSRNGGPQQDTFPPRAFDRERVPDEVLGTRTVTTERKTFTVSRRKNRGGEFLRVDEVRPGRDRDMHSVIIVPAEQVEDFLVALEELFPEPPE